MDSEKKINKLKEEVASKKEQLENALLEIQYLKDELLQNNLTTSEREQLQNLKKEIYEERARTAKFSENLAKAKQELLNLQN